MIESLTFVPYLVFTALKSCYIYTTIILDMHIILRNKFFFNENI